jgi:hypothetical protein
MEWRISMRETTLNFLFVGIFSIWKTCLLFLWMWKVFFKVRVVQKQLWLQRENFSIANYSDSRSQSKVQASILIEPKWLHSEVTDIRASGFLVVSLSKVIKLEYTNSC